MKVGPQTNLETHSNKNSMQANWSHKITIFFLCIDIDIGTKVQKLLQNKKKNPEFRTNLENLHP